MDFCWFFSRNEFLEIRATTSKRLNISYLQIKQLLVYCLKLLESEKFDILFVADQIFKMDLIENNIIVDRVAWDTKRIEFIVASKIKLLFLHD